MQRFIIYARKSTDEKDRQILSLESQINELRELAIREHLEIVAEYTEAKTAKTPGRPVFSYILQQIEKHHADGILAWHPDRLARNSIDGGKIIYLIDIGKIVDLRFPTYRFDNTAQGKFMLSIAFSQSKYYVDNLSENVKRGFREKLRRGEWPGCAPLGYLNDYKNHVIVPDAEKAPFIRRFFELCGTGLYTTTELFRETRKWGLTGKTGKKECLRSSITPGTDKTKGARFNDRTAH
jgi:DNA invertase Pin-like site-specific DNA recombinase